MKIRDKKTKEEGSSGDFNTSSLTEIYVYFDDWTDSDFPDNYDVFIESKNEWVDLRQAFRVKDIITDNYNTRFFEPKNDEEKERGYSL